MNIVVSLVVGALIGWIVSMRNSRAGREALFRNIGWGIAGAFAGRWILGLLIESAAPTGFSIAAMIASSIGAAALLLVIARLNPQ
jgi:uncharacterized membrane protein YeaQ/YmgE (transglycosylase-associated protein family)